MVSLRATATTAALRPADRGTVDPTAIAAAALHLFAERGYRATTMAEIGAAVGIRGPSLYKHVRAKQDLLGAIMIDTMRSLIAVQQAALDAGGGVVLQLRRVVEAHVRYHATHREQAFVGNRDIGNLAAPYFDEVIHLRDTYEHTLRNLLEAGCGSGEFMAPHPRLISYAILDMGIGVASWFRPDGMYGADEIAFVYADIAVGMVSAAPPARGWPPALP